MKNLILLSQAISNLRPGIGFSIEEDDLSTLIFSVEVEKPSSQEILQEYNNLLQNVTSYKTLREKEYPSIGDQLDALFKAGVFPEEMAAQIQAVKDKYPKQG